MSILVIPTRSNAQRAAIVATPAANPPARFRLGHRPELDGLRGIAVLAVIAGHASLPLPLAGFVGVDIFFVLSGFLITTLLLQEWDDNRTISVWRFYARRSLRIIPAFLVLLVATAVYAVAFASAEVSAIMWPAIVVSGTYLSNWAIALPATPEPLGFLSHTWSLATEEQFYVIWPVLVVASLRMGASRRKMARFVATGILLLLVLRVCLIVGGVPGHRLYAGFDTHGADSLLMGCFVALWIAQNPKFEMGWPLLICRTAAVCGGLFTLWVMVIGLDIVAYILYGISTAVALATAATIVVLLNRGAPMLRRLVGSNVLARTGRISYGLYLWHFPIHCWLWQHLVHERGWPVSAVGVLAVVVTFLVAIASYQYIERPLLRLKPHCTRRISSTLHSECGQPQPEYR